MTAARFGLLLASAGTAALAGCVDRRFVVETNVPGAQIYVDGKPIGPAPADSWFVYPGVYEFKAVAPGHQPLIQPVEFKAKWYDYPPLDLFAEVFYPGRIEDVRRVRLTLEPTRPVNTADLLRDADGLRAKGKSLPPPSVPDDDGPVAPPSPAVPPPSIRTLPPGPFPPQQSGYVPLASGVPAKPVASPGAAEPAILPAGGPAGGSVGTFVR